MSRRAQRRICRDCRKMTLAGGCKDPTVGTIWPVRADPKPIDELGEAIAALAGRRTFDLAADGELLSREAWHIAHARYRPVLAQHRCGQPLPPARPDCPGLPPLAGAPDTEPTY
jgi:hypothetical protein